MKKRFFIVFIIIISVFLFCIGCKNNVLKKYKPYLSELRTNVFCSIVDNYEIDAITGKKEKNFQVDGQASELEPFTIITIQNIDKEANYSAKIDNKEHVGLMLKHPFENSISCEIRAETTNTSIPFSFTIDNKKINCELKSVFDPEVMINYNKAFNIALKKLNKQIKALWKNNKLHAEVYIRLILNPINDTNEYYWYIAFVSKDNKTYAILINPKNENIIAIRDN